MVRIGNVGAGIAALCLVGGCAFEPLYDGWDLTGEPAGVSDCNVFPALPTSVDFLEAADGFTVALPDGSVSAPCALDGRDFDCEPLAFDWRYADGEVESILGEDLALSGSFADDREASGTAVIALACRDDDCPNPDACSATFAFEASYQEWFGF